MVFDVREFYNVKFVNKINKKNPNILKCPDIADIKTKLT